MIYAKGTMEQLEAAAKMPQNLMLRADGGFHLMDYAVATAEKWLGSELSVHNNPDALVIEGEKSITKDMIDDVISFTYTTPVEAEYKVIIIDDFQNTNLSSQSALLKVLEDGSKAAKFILIVRGDVLPTISSRCMEVFVYPPVQEDFLDGDSDTVLFWASNGDIELYSQLSDDDEAKSLLYKVPKAAFSKKELLGLFRMDSEYDSVWDKENLRKPICNFFSALSAKVSNASLLGDFSEAVPGFKCFECFGGKFADALTLLDLATSFGEEFAKGTATRNSFLLFLTEYSSKCEKCMRREVKDDVSTEV